MKTPKKKHTYKRRNMGETQYITFSFSYETHISNNLEIHLIIKRSNTDQNDITVQIPYTMDGTGPTRENLKRNLEYMLTYHEIPQSVEEK